MGLRIKSNIESVVAQNRLDKSRQSMTNSLEKLSSGQRINRASDDAAGLAVSESMRARISSLSVAKRNANDGISYMQVAEGGVNEISNIVVRMRELASQAASDTLGDRERGFLDKEFQQLRQEVIRISEGVEFNGQKILKLTDDSKPIQFMVGASNRSNDASGNAPSYDPDNDPDVLTLDMTELAKLSDTIETFQDADLLSIATEDNAGGQELGSDGTEAIFNTLDTALTNVASYRATIGAYQSRLNSTISNIDVATENLQAANSRIRDVDYASETANYAQSRILTQAGASVLAQANQSPELALSLLR